jgi:hypothetical protein
MITKLFRNRSRRSNYGIEQRLLGFFVKGCTDTDNEDSRLRKRGNIFFDSKISAYVLLKKFLKSVFMKMGDALS